ncbi:MAG: polymer-forming cytoskeletal protein [Anaerolineales bacterium]|jgi:hypothetical protein
MTRILIIFSLAAVVLSTLSMPFLVLHPGQLVLGGQHHITSDTPLSKNVSFYFAQVKIDEDAKVEGQIFLYSSTLDIRGTVTEDIHAFESDLTLHESAHVEGEIDQNDLIHWTLLLPAIVQIP